MSYSSTESCVLDLERAGHLVRIKEEVDPHLEMASIHLRVRQSLLKDTSVDFYLLIRVHLH